MVSGICVIVINLFFVINGLKLRLKNGQVNEAARKQGNFTPARTFVSRLVHRFGGFVSS
jgi:hypothetical protein